MQSLVNGAISGIMVALVALGFSLVYLPTRIFHIAIAGIISITPYICFTALDKNLSLQSAVILSVIVAVLVSILFELINHRYLERKKASHGAHLISSIGLYIVITQFVSMIWGNETMVLAINNPAFNFFQVVVTRAQVFELLFGFTLLIGGFVWLRYSGLGLRYRALADNPIELSLKGCNINHCRIFAFAISGFFAGVASLATAYDVGFEPYGGLHMMLLGLVAVIIGGRGSFLGPVLGGLILGLLRAQVDWHFSARWQDVFTFLLLAIFLYVRPSGIFSPMQRLEVQK